MTTAVFLLGTALQAGGSIYSGQQQKKAAKSQARIARLETQRQKAEAHRARREVVRNARAAQGQVVNQGANKGVLDSSGVAGGEASVVSQANTEISFLDQADRIADMTSTELGRIRKYQSRAQTGQLLGRFGSAIAQSQPGQSGQSALFAKFFGGG